MDRIVWRVVDEQGRTLCQVHGTEHNKPLIEVAPGMRIEARNGSGGWTDVTPDWLHTIK